MKSKITIGKSKVDNSAVHVSEAQNGLSCNCVCYDCGNNLEAHQGKKKDWHFKHHEDSNCEGGKDKALHELAVKLLSENNEFHIDSNSVFEYDVLSVEKKVGNFIPDLRVKSKEGAVWWIEVAVTHFMEKEKLSFVKETNQLCIEINLSNLPRDISKEKLLEFLKDDYLSKVKYPKAEQNSSSSSQGIIAIVGMIIGVFFLRKFFRRRR